MKYAAILSSENNLNNREGSQIANVIYIPDLKLKFNMPENMSFSSELTEKIQKKVIEHVAEQKSQNIVINAPSSTEEIRKKYQDKIASPIFFYLNIDYKNERKFFEKSLPIFGHVMNLLALFCNSILVLMSIIITLNNDKDENLASTLALSIVGSILSFTITLVMYIFSGASLLLADSGKKIDDKLFRNDPEMATFCGSAYREKLKKDCSVGRFFATTGGVAIVGIGNVIGGIKNYQETLALSEKMHDQYETFFTGYGELLAWIYVISLALSNLAYQGSFFRSFIDWITDKITGNKHKDLIMIDDSEFNEYSNISLDFSQSSGLTK